MIKKILEAAKNAERRAVQDLLDYVAQNQRKLNIIRAGAADFGGVSKEWGALAGAFKTGLTDFWMTFADMVHTYELGYLVGWTGNMAQDIYTLALDIKRWKNSTNPKDLGQAAMVHLSVKAAVNKLQHRLRQAPVGQLKRRKTKRSEAF